MTQEYVSPIIVRSQQPTSVTQIIQGASGQSANLQEWRNSSGTVLLAINSDGQIAPATAASVGLVIKGLASQSGDYFQVQNSGGAVLAKIDNSYGLTLSASGRFNGGLGINGSQVGVAWFFVNIGSAGDKGAVIRGASGQTNNLQEWQDSSGTVLAKVSASGSITSPYGSFGVSAPVGTTVAIGTNAASAIGIIIKGFASQTANLQEWQNSSGTVLSGINNAGQIFSNNGIIVNATIYGINGTSAPTLTFNSSSILLRTRGAALNGLIIQGADSQTANLQEWQDSAGNVLSYMASNGHLQTPRLVITTGGNITDSAGTTPYFGFGSNQIAIYTRNAAYKGLIIQGSASQTANLTEWQNSAGTIVARVGNGGQIVSSGVGVFGAQSNPSNAQLAVVANSTTYPTVVIKSIASQAANLQEWQNSSGSALAYINQYGDFRTYGSASIGNAAGLGQLSVQNYGTSTVVAVIRGAASQTADLQQWQDSAGTVYARVRPSGQIGIGSTLITGTNFFVNNTISTTSVVATIRGAASQTANLQEWQNSSGTVLASVDAYGTLLSNWKAYIQSGASYLIPMTIVGASGQTANLQEWKNSSGNVLAKIAYDGKLTVGYGAGGGIAIGSLSFGGVTYNGISNPAGVTSTPTLVIKGIASQTANLQEWQNSAGTVLARIASDGTLSVASGNMTVNSGGSIYAAYLNTNNAYFVAGQENSGGFIRLTKETASASAPGTDMAKIYLVAGTNAGTLKLVVRAGASGAETTILDNIPQS